MEHRAGRKPENSMANHEARQAGKTYLFGIGINNYEHWPNLNNAVRDMDAVTKVLQEKYGVVLRKVLRDEAATRKGILRELKAIVQEVKAPDSIIIYYAGHGHVDKYTGLGSWVPTEAEKDDVDYIANSRLRDFLQVAEAQHVLFISDACFSGSLLQERSNAEVMMLDEMAARPSRWVMCSGRADEAVADGARGGHSPFAQAIIDELTYNQDQGLGAALFAQKVQLESKRHYPNQLSDYGPVYGTGDKRGQLVLWLNGEAELPPEKEKEDNTSPGDRRGADDLGAKYPPGVPRVEIPEPQPEPEGMTLALFKTKVTNYLIEDKAKAALEFMRKTLGGDHALQNTILLQLGRVNRLRRQVDEGTIAQSNAQIEQNRINAAVNNMVADVEKGDF